MLYGLNKTVLKCFGNYNIKQEYLIKGHNYWNLEKEGMDLTFQ